MNAAAQSSIVTSPPRANRQWVHSAAELLHQHPDAHTETPMQLIQPDSLAGITFLFKDETSHASGSLKHRLARSLFLYALCSGRLKKGQTVIDASSGSTAISEAWFARLLGLPFIAVMPECTAIAKQLAVTELGGRCELVANGTDMAQIAAEIALQTGACFLDQFGLAGHATDWRGNNNIAESILQQSNKLVNTEPDWIICGVGTGGTSSTIGRFLRYHSNKTQLCVAEPTGAAFAVGWPERNYLAHATQKTVIEGIGRTKVEPCFLFEVVDHLIEVDDVDSIRGALALQDITGTLYGGSSGTNWVAALTIARQLHAVGRSAVIALLLCDRGERYQDTLFNPQWQRRMAYPPLDHTDLLI